MANDFLTTYTPLANDIATATGLDPSVVLGIIDTETGGGAHVSGNNIFGISPGGRVAGYPDVQTASQAFVSLLQTPRYRGIAAAGDPASQAQALVRAGYNTANPNYATIVANKALAFGKQLGYQDGGNAPAQPAAYTPPDYTNAPAQPATPAQPAPQAKQPPSLVQELQQDTGGSGAGTATAPAAPADKPPSLTEELQHDIDNPPKGGLTGPPEKPSLIEQLKAPRDDEGYFDPGSGMYVPPRSMPTKQQAADYEKQTPEDLDKFLPIFPKPAPGIQILTPAAREAVSQGGPMGRYIVNPLLDAAGWAGAQIGQLGGMPFQAAGAAADLLNPQLGRDIRAMPEAFPLAGQELGGLRPAGPGDYGSARAGAAKGPLSTRFTPPPPVTLAELTGAVERAGGAPDAASALNPDQVAREAAAQAQAQAQATGAASAGGAAPAAAPTDGSTFLDGDWLRQAGDAGGGYDMKKGGEALVGEVQAALDRGDTVHLVADRGAKTVPIVAIKDGMMQDAQGQRWGSAPMAFDGTGREGVRITPSEATRAANDTTIPEAEAPQPQAAGAAATPPGAIPAQRDVERARNLRGQINESALDRAGPGLRDNNAYVTDVPGGETLPTRIDAERDFSPQNALDHKYSYNTDENYRAAYDKQRAARNQGMDDLLKNDAGDELTLDQARRTRRDVAPGAFGAFEGETPVPRGAAELVAHIDRILDSPEGKRDAVERTMNNVRSKLYDRNGKLETKPSQLYGVVGHINDLKDKAQRPVDREGSDAAVSRFALDALRDHANRVIQTGAPRYQAYRQAYRDMSQTVNQQRFLQRYQAGGKKLTGSDGFLQLPKVNQMLEDIHKGLTDTKFNLAKSLTEQQIQNVVNVRNELAARKLMTDQAATPGSPTVQLLNRAAAKGGGALGAIMHAGLGTVAHAAGTYAQMPGVAEAGALYTALSPYVRMMRQQRAARLAAAKDAAVKAKLLSQAPPNLLNPY